MNVVYDHSLGCTIVGLTDLCIDVCWGPGRTCIDLCNAIGLRKLKEQLIQRGRGCVALWTDGGASSEDFKHEAGYKLYTRLKQLGEYVEKSKAVNNPSGSPYAGIFYWYFRKKPKALNRPSKTTRRKPNKKKAKTTTNKSSAKSSRSS